MSPTESVSMSATMRLTTMLFPHCYKEEYHRRKQMSAFGKSKASVNGNYGPESPALAPSTAKTTNGCMVPNLTVFVLVAPRAIENGDALQGWGDTTVHRVQS